MNGSNGNYGISLTTFGYAGILLLMANKSSNMVDCKNHKNGKCKTKRHHITKGCPLDRKQPAKNVFTPGTLSRNEGAIPKTSQSKEVVSKAELVDEYSTTALGAHFSLDAVDDVMGLMKYLHPRDLTEPTPVIWVDGKMVPADYHAVGQLEHSSNFAGWIVADDKEVVFTQSLDDTWGGLTVDGLEIVLDTEEQLIAEDYQRYAVGVGTDASSLGYLLWNGDGYRWTQRIDH